MYLGFSAGVTCGVCVWLIVTRFRGCGLWVCFSFVIFVLGLRWETVVVALNCGLGVRVRCFFCGYSGFAMSFVFVVGV